MDTTRAQFDGRSTADRELGLVPLTLHAGIQMQGMALVLPSSIRTRVITELLQQEGIIGREALIAACNSHPEAEWWLRRYPDRLEEIVIACKADITQAAGQHTLS